MTIKSLDVNKSMHNSRENYNREQNTYSTYWAGQATDSTHIGACLTEGMDHKINASVRVDDAFAAGESTVITLKRVKKEDGTLENLFELTLDENTVTAAGEYMLDANSFVKMVPGDVVIADRVYVPGGTPNNPANSLVVQLY